MTIERIVDGQRVKEWRSERQERSEKERERERRKRKRSGMMMVFVEVVKEFVMD